LIFIYSAFATATIMTSTTSSAANNPLAIGTRLHLGHASHPPPHSQLHETLSSFAKLASTVGADFAVVAVDAEEKLEGYDLVEEVTQICRTLNEDALPLAAPLDTSKKSICIQVLSVTPWGKFVPALNAIVAWCARRECRYLLLASAEVQLTNEVMDTMKCHLDLENMLCVGPVLQGHTYRNSEEGAKDGLEIQVELNGRTTPWNTCCLWNVPKLALTGFLLVSEGLHPDNDEDGVCCGEGTHAGVEEVCTIATLQRILSPENARAKLISIPGTSWGQDFGNDKKRKEWHERKMMSKVTRAKRQLELMGLSGTVIHC
jgi:hypothetical protein